MFVKLCEGCPREEICQERICNSSWQREWLCSWDNIRKAATEIEKAAHVATHGRRVTDNFVPYRKYVYGHILTAGWRDVK